MTNEEAIRVLGRMLDEFCNEDAWVQECKDAVDMAIEALKEQSKHDQNVMSKQQDLETLGIKTGETCEDVISRKAAIDALREAENHAFNSFYKGLVKAHKIIADIPSAQPERKKGLWKVIRYNGDMQRYARCKCGYEYGAGKFDGLKFVALKLHNFCPNCGADMRGEAYGD